jgi:DNA-binding transcriptional regulator YiaG
MNVSINGGVLKVHMDVSNIGDRINHLRRNNNMTQEQLGVVLNVSPQAVSKWEKETRCPISLL